MTYDLYSGLTGCRHVSFEGMGQDFNVLLLSVFSSHSFINEDKLYFMVLVLVSFSQESGKNGFVFRGLHFSSFSSLYLLIYLNICTVMHIMQFTIVLWNTLIHYGSVH